MSWMFPSAPVQWDIHLLEVHCPKPHGFELPMTEWSKRCSSSCTAVPQAGHRGFLLPHFC